MQIKPQQKIARLGPYIEHVSQYNVLRMFLLGQIALYNHMLRGTLDHAGLPIIFLIAEALFLGWPQHWIRIALSSIPRRHSTPFIRATRRLAYVFKRVPFRQVCDQHYINDLVKNNSVYAQIVARELNSEQ